MFPSIVVLVIGICCFLAGFLLGCMIEKPKPYISKDNSEILKKELTSLNLENLAKELSVLDQRFDVLCRHLKITIDRYPQREFKVYENAGGSGQNGYVTQTATTMPGAGIVSGKKK